MVEGKRTGMNGIKLHGKKRDVYLREMFAGIAQRYDLLNRLMTAGQDIRWRQEVISRASLPQRGSIVDLGAGTGDLAREALRQYPNSKPVAVDFTLEMMRVGMQRDNAPSLEWSAGNALHLPFEEETFNASVSGFLMRNVSNVDKCLQEQYRLLKKDGVIVTLDTTQPPRNLLSPILNFYLHVIIPILGGLITGERQAYTYLPGSTVSFMKAERLAECMKSVGFREIGFRRLMFGVIAIHWGRK